MIAKLKFALLAVVISVSLTGCAGFDLFGCCDRYCYLADWANHHSCLSCCKHGCCCEPPIIDCTPNCPNCRK
jgi:hypothetical protein